MEEPEGLIEWAELHVPRQMRDDPIWTSAAYRYALCLGDLVQGDVPLIERNRIARRHVDQLLDAVQSISANIAEGYSRSTGRDRAKYFEYAHSSARESREWLFKIRHALDPATALHRITLVTRIMTILVATIPRERETPDSPAHRPKPEYRPPDRRNRLRQSAPAESPPSDRDGSY